MQLIRGALLQDRVSPILPIHYAHDTLLQCVTTAASAAALLPNTSRKPILMG